MNSITEPADTIIVAKVGRARPEDIEKVITNVRRVNRCAHLIKTDFIVDIDKPELISGKRVVVVEDAPTVTQGCPYGAGYIASEKYGAERDDPKRYDVGSLKRIYEIYPHMGSVIPSMGYTSEHLKDLEETINKTEADEVVLGTPA